MSVETDDLFVSRSDGGKVITHVVDGRLRGGRHVPQMRFQANSIKPPAGFYSHRHQPTEPQLVNYR